jgi:hypothetical protein
MCWSTPAKSAEEFKRGLDKYIDAKLLNISPDHAECIERIARQSTPGTAGELPMLPPLPKPHMHLSVEWGSDDYPVFLTAQLKSYAEQVQREAFQAARFFMDHGVWHDRFTGQHLWTQDQYDEQWRDMYKAGHEDADIGFDMLTGKSIARQSAPEGAPVGMGGWLPIESAPQDGRTILLGLFNSRGNWRTMRGQWYSAAAIDDEWEDPDAGEEGWYETAAEPDPPNCWSVHPTHWMPLPSAPQPARQDQQPAQHDHSEGGHAAQVQQAVLPPLTPEEIVAFIGSHYNVMRDAENGDVESIEYQLTVHDIQSAFRWWFEDYVDWVAAHYDKQASV